MDSLVSHLPPAVPRDPMIRLGQLAMLLRRRLWLVALCAVLAALAAYGYARTQPKTYTASTALVVEGSHFAIPELQGALRDDNAPDPMPWVRTELQALTARALVEAVAAQLRLDQVPEFNPALQSPGLVQRAKDYLSTAVAPVLPVGPANAPEPGPNDAVFGAVSRALGVFQDNRSLVIAITFTAQDPRLAATFLNTLVSQYEQIRAHNRLDANQSANAVLSTRIDQVRTELSGIEQQMRDLRSKGELAGVRAGSVGQQQAEELTTAAARATLERSQLDANYERAAAAARSGSSDTLAAVLNSPTISRLRDNEAQAQRRIAELSTHYDADYPGLRSANAELAIARQQLTAEAGRIVASLGAQLRVARTQEADVQAQLDTARRASVQGENSRAELDQLQQEATSRRALYNTLLEREQQTISQPSGTQAPDVRVLSPAVPPGGPSGPNIKLAALMGGGGGALLGCLVALTLTGAADGFEGAGDVMAATGLPVLATLPGRLLPRRLQPVSVAISKLGITKSRGEPAIAEAMRGLRARLLFSGRTGTPRSVLFVPAGIETHGQISGLAGAFARAVAADGERVLLIEGDLQAPRLAGAFGQDMRDDAHGLLAVLAGADWREAVVPDSQPGLELLLAAGRAPGAGALLSGVAFQNLLIESCLAYDLVVLNASPADSAEAAALAARVDTVVLVVDGRAKAEATRVAAGRLGAASRTPLAVLLLARS